MEKIEQIRLIDGLLNQLDKGATVDAGKQLISPVNDYLSAERAENEWQTFFQNYPQFMGLSGELPEARSFFTNDDLGKPILCTCDKDGNFQAFINACRHRGSIVETKSRGKKSKFSCPIHAWTYSANGDLVAVPREEHFGEVDKACYSLVKLPAVEQYGMLWVHPDPEGEIDVDELLGEKLAKELEDYQLGNCVFSAEDQYDHEMNWKLANDTFGEAYHFNVLHKDTAAQIFYGNVQMYDIFKRNHRLTLCMKAIDEVRDLPKEDWDVMKVTMASYYLFPNIQILMTSFGPVIFRIYPRGSNANDSYSKVLFYLNADIANLEDNAEMAAIASYQQSFNGAVVRDEDYVVAASSHRGMAAGHIDHVVFG